MACEAERVQRKEDGGVHGGVPIGIGVKRLNHMRRRCLRIPELVVTNFQEQLCNGLPSSHHL